MLRRVTLPMRDTIDDAEMRQDMRAAARAAHAGDAALSCADAPRVMRDAARALSAQQRKICPITRAMLPCYARAIRATRSAPLIITCAYASARCAVRCAPAAQ